MSCLFSNDVKREFWHFELKTFWELLIVVLRVERKQTSVSCVGCYFRREADVGIVSGNIIAITRYWLLHFLFKAECWHYIRRGCVFFLVILNMWQFQTICQFLKCNRRNGVGETNCCLLSVSEHKVDFDFSPTRKTPRGRTGISAQVSFPHKVSSYHNSYLLLHVHPQETEGFLLC